MERSVRFLSSRSRGKCRSPCGATCGRLASGRRSPPKNHFYVAAKRAGGVVMTVVVAGSGFPIPCCEPTKNQSAWIAMRLQWALGVFYFTPFLTHHSPEHRSLTVSFTPGAAVILEFAPGTYSQNRKCIRLSLSNTQLHTRRMSRICADRS
jgi:hypothetical protein